MDSKAQAAAVDMALTLLIIAVFISVVSASLGDFGLSVQKSSGRDAFTQSLLVSMLDSSPKTAGFENRSIARMITSSMQDPSLNESLQQEIEQHMGLYAKDRGIEWVLYSNSSVWIPWGRVLRGREVSSASAELLLPDNESARIYLFLRWD